MIASNRSRRAKIRTMVRETRTHNRAVREVNTGRPQTARTHLIAAGIDTATAHRFSGAFSRSVIPTATSTTKVKLTKRSRKVATFTARLAVYRPTKDKTAAATFATAALAIAA